LADPFPVRFARVPISHPDAALLVEEVQAEYVVRYGGPDQTPVDVTEFVEPAGAFFVGYLDDLPVVCGAWRRRADVEAFGSRLTAEVKRMYVVPAGRGLGLAKAMLAHLEDTARASGAEVIVLETGTAQPEAMSLYQSAGYTSIPSFGYYAYSPLNRCYARSLLPPTPDDPTPGPPPAPSSPPGSRPSHP
jgi:GNAT superfamily N-acetyltransferase